MQREKLLVFVALIAVVSGYKEDPSEYEAEGVNHIDYEQDQMSIKMNPGERSTSLKRMDRMSESPQVYERTSVRHSFMENNQTPAEDRNWQVKPKTKRMSQKSGGGRKVHIYLKNEDPKKVAKKQTSSASSATTTSTLRPSESTEGDTEVQTKKTPELTTKSDKDARGIKFVDKDSIAESSVQTKQTVDPKDAQTEGSEHFDHVVKEKIKIKHHHHHHHHNHVKTVVKKEPYPVEKIVHVPVEKIVEKKVPYKVEVEKVATN